tara:strand:- start:26554 stop:27321 length:768 start_codon:yes stop_codon:yes gene_type:complete
MKQLLLSLFIFCGFVNLQAKTTIDDFIGKKFTLSHYLINNDDTREEITDIDIENATITVEPYNGHDSSIATTNTTFYISGSFECSIYNSIYNFNTNNTFTPFKIVEGATLGGVGCGRATYFPVLLGFDSDSPNILNFDFTTEDNLILWSDVNRKFVFTVSINAENSYQPPSTASVSKEELNDSIQITSNATDKTICIKAPNLILTQTSIIDALGRIVAIENKSFTKISTSSFPQGVYFIKVDTNKGNITKQIVIN